MEIEQHDLSSNMEEDCTDSNPNDPVPVPILNAEEDKDDAPELHEPEHDELKFTAETTETDVHVQPDVSGITETEPDFEDFVHRQDDNNVATTLNADADLIENLQELEELKTENAEVDTEITEPVAGIRIDAPQITSMEEAESAESVPPDHAEDEIKIETPEVTTQSLIQDIETEPPVSVKEEDDLDITLHDEISLDPPSDQDQSSMSATESKKLESENTSNLDETSMDSVSVCNEITPSLSPKRSSKSTNNEASVSPTRPPSTRNKFTRDKALFDEMKFMADFDPTSSNRNREKKRKRYTDGRQQLIADHYDDCDCLLKNCPGCHYPCKRCGDPRCGHECRQGRRWLYESIEVEGRGIELRNPHINN